MRNWPSSEMQGVENDDLAVPVNKTFVHHTSFLAADTQPCVLMLFWNTFTQTIAHHSLNFIPVSKSFKMVNF